MASIVRAEYSEEGADVKAGDNHRYENLRSCVGLSPRANYTDRATAACWRS
jgi:hypothetical protein